MRGGAAAAHCISSRLPEDWNTVSLKLCQLHQIHPAEPRSQNIVERAGCGSVHCCTLFSIPSETQTLTTQTASRLRQMGRLHCTAFPFSWLLVPFLGAGILACRCEALVRTNCSGSFTRHWAAVYYSQEQESNPSIYLSESCDTWFCPLLSLKNTLHSPDTSAGFKSACR